MTDFAHCLDINEKFPNLLLNAFWKVIYCSGLLMLCWKLMISPCRWVIELFYSVCMELNVE